MLKTQQPRKRDDKGLENSCTVEGRNLDLDLSKVYEELLTCTYLRVCSVETHRWRAIIIMVDSTCAEKTQLIHWEGKI